MAADQSLSNQPIFVVGSPRSGTSILTWCLGQHPNLLCLEESNWMTSFAVDLAVAFRRGSARGERSQFSSMGMQRDQLMEDIGASINRFIIAHARTFEARRMQLANPSAPENHAAFKIARDESDPKSRWVNGTPEYSLGIGGLRKLFPHARFIHLVRDCDLVVPSMLHFDRVSGIKLVETEEEAYLRWLACVRACMAAESAYGPETVSRIFLEDLVQEPERWFCRIFEFIGEPFAPSCLEPLSQRINSSKLEPGDEKRGPAADPGIVAEARELWEALRENRAPSSPASEAASRIEERFERRVTYIHNLDAQYSKTQRDHRKLQGEFTERTKWALGLNQTLAEKGREILELQKEFSERNKWAQDLEKEIAQRDSFIRQLQQEFAERTAWALQLRDECDRKDALILDLQAQLRNTKPSSDSVT